MATNTKTATSTGKSISNGDKVELVGLQNSPHLNHRFGLVVGDVLDNGRYPVALDGKKIAVKPENLKKFEGGTTGHGVCRGCLLSFSHDGLMVCKKCQMVEYCSQKCQLSHWHEKHKEDCKMFQQGRNAGQDETQLPTDPLERRIVRDSRGLRWAQKGKYAKAEAELRALIRENPPTSRFRASSGHYALLVHAIMQQAPGPDEVDEAIAYLREATTLPIPKSEQAHVTVMEIYYTLGEMLLKTKFDLDGAEQAYNEALKLECTNASKNASETSANCKKRLEEIKEHRCMLLGASK